MLFNSKMKVFIVYETNIIGRSSLSRAIFGKTTGSIKTHSPVKVELSELKRRDSSDILELLNKSCQKKRKVILEKQVF